MVNEIHGIVSNERLLAQHGEESFLRDVIAPIYEVLRKVAIMFLCCCSFHFGIYMYSGLNCLCLVKKEAKRNKGGKASHSAWRNYDDLNEYFWYVFRI